MGHLGDLILIVLAYPPWIGGMTARQIFDHLHDTSLPQVHATLDRLAKEGRVLEVGKWYWII